MRTGERPAPNEACAPCAKTQAGCQPQAALPLACGYENYVPSGLAVTTLSCLKGGIFTSAGKRRAACGLQFLPPKNRQKSTENNKE